MGKKNIKPLLNQPVIRTNVAKSALEGLTEENLTTTARQTSAGGVAATGEGLWGIIQYLFNPCTCSYDGDDAE